MPETHLKIVTATSALSKPEKAAAIKAANEAVAKLRNITSTPAVKRKVGNLDLSEELADLSEELLVEGYDMEIKCLRNSDILLRNAIDAQSLLIRAMQKTLDKLVATKNDGQSNSQVETAAGLVSPPMQFVSKLYEHQKQCLSSPPDRQKEMRDRTEKQYNVVICDLPETDNPTPQSVHRRDPYVNPELSLVREVLIAAGGDPNSIEEVFRMGQPKGNGRGRPIKVKCSTARDQSLLLRAGGIVKDTVRVAERVFIRRDQTEYQRAVSAAARVALTAARERSPGKQLVLREGDDGFVSIYEKKGGSLGVKPNVTFYSEVFDTAAIGNGDEIENIVIDADDTNTDDNAAATVSKK
jgi:hypothetical protein